MIERMGENDKIVPRYMAVRSSGAQRFRSSRGRSSMPCRRRRPVLSRLGKGLLTDISSLAGRPCC